MVSETIAGCGILAQGRMHVAAIRDAGSLIIGRLRPATGEERRTLPVMSVWGRQVIQLLAEKHFVHH